MLYAANEELLAMAPLLMFKGDDGGDRRAELCSRCMLRELPPVPPAAESRNT